MTSKSTKPEDTPPASPAIAPIPPAEPDVVDAASEPDDGRREYVVTELAPGKVAGRRVKAKEKLRLTVEEARSELLSGFIVPPGKRLPKAMLKPGKAA